MVQLNYRFVEENIDRRYCECCGHMRNVSELQKRKDGTYVCADNYDYYDFLASMSEDELEEYYEWLDEEEKKKEEWEEKYSKMDLDELERRDFRRKFPTIECDGCGEVHNTEDMDLGIDATGEVVLVLCKKCAGIK